MGQSTDAIIAFGFDLGEEIPESLSELMSQHEHDPDQALAEDYGIALPEYAPGCDYKAYAAAMESALAGLKIDLIAHCSGDYPMYFLAARGSNKRASRGNPTALSENDFLINHLLEKDAMRAFCDRHGVEWQEPKWHIFSMWN